MGPVKINDDTIISVIVTGSLLFLLIILLIGFFAVSPRFAGGVLAGGCLSLANFFWLSRALKQILHLPAQTAGRYAQLRYILRLAVMALFLYILLVFVHIDIIGLLSGLSILFFSMAALAFYRLTFKGGS